jgi:hypothetical protein
MEDAFDLNSWPFLTQGPGLPLMHVEEPFLPDNFGLSPYQACSTGVSLASPPTPVVIFTHGVY